MTSPTPPEASPPLQPTLLPKQRRSLVRRIVFRVVFWYVMILVALTAFQRKMIYFPTRAAAIPAAESGLAAGTVHDFTFRTSDGLELHGWHLLAAGHACEMPEECDAELASGRPVVLFFHGNGGDRRLRLDDCQALTDAGADVLLIDYRGYGENLGSPSEAGLMLDAHALWEYATQQRGIAPGRIILYGESLGGGVAVPLCAAKCDAGTPPAGLIVRSTFTSLADAAAHHYWWLPVRWLLVDRFASVDVIGRVTCPMLHLHGARDQVVPIESGRRLFEAAPDQSAGGVLKRFIEFPHADHNDLLFVAGKEFRAAIVEFIDVSSR